MAYLDLNLDRDPTSMARRVPTPGEAAVTDAFSPLEWNVIALARNDGLRSLGQPGPIARALGGLFGEGRQSRLADPRLEALRRFAVHAWHRGFALPETEIGRLVAAGFSVGHAERALISITGTRARWREGRLA